MEHVRYTFPHIAFISRSKAPFNFPLSPSFFSFRLLCLYPLQDTILHQRWAARCGRVALGTGQVPGLGVKLVRSTIGMMVQGPSEALSLVQSQPRLHQFINRLQAARHGAYRWPPLSATQLPKYIRSTELPNRISLASAVCRCNACRMVTLPPLETPRFLACVSTRPLPTASLIFCLVLGSSPWSYHWQVIGFFETKCAEFAGAARPHVR